MKPGSIAGTPTCVSRPEACDADTVRAPRARLRRHDRRETRPPRWVRCRVPIENIDYGVRELLRLGNEVSVIGPADIRKAVSETAHALAQHHDTKPPPSSARRRL